MKKNECLNREELIKKLSAKPEKIVDIPGWGKVTIQAPDFEKVVQMSINHQGISQQQMKSVITLMSVKELMIEDVLKLSESNDGFQVAALINAVSEALNLGDEGLGKHTKG